MSASIFGDGGLTSGQVSAQVAAMMHPGYPPASYAWMTQAFGSNIAMAAADTIYWYWFPLSTRLRINTIWMRTVTGGAGSAVKCAVWRNNRLTARPTGLPVLGQNAGFDTTTNAQNDSAPIADVWLDDGIIWLGTKGTGTLPAMITVGNTGPLACGIPGASIAAIGAASFNALSAPDAYANDIMAFDASGATFTHVGSNGIPAIGLGWN